MALTVDAMKLSIVTTLFRSAPFIDEFHRRISAVAGAITDDFEIVMVDDGSPDESLQVARRLAAADSRVKVIELSRNFGHHKAMMTGLDAAQGEFVFLIDVDLEEEPELLAQFWSTLFREDADVVYGFQTTRKGHVLERLGGALHWWVIRRLSSYPIPQNLVTARLMKRVYVRSLLLHREQKTAIGGLWAITGYRQLGVPVTKRSRGESSYSLGRRIAAGFEGITSFSEKPLILVFLLGVIIFGIALLGGTYLVFLRFSGRLLSGWASVMVSIWMLGGLSIASMGILGLYVARIFIETKRRPYSIVRAIHDSHGTTFNDGQTRSTGQ
jgi:putative glycosyltransferase